jgi:hypothetical protein
MNKKTVANNCYNLLLIYESSFDKIKKENNMLSIQKSFYIYRVRELYNSFSIS